jgi:hypothetical protein
MTNEWMKKMFYKLTSEYYSAIKKNEIKLFSEKWMELEISMLSKVNQTEKYKYML